MSCLLTLAACSETKHYRDTTALETPPRLAITEQGSSRRAPSAQQADQTSLADSVRVDDEESPTILTIEKLFDRAWDLIGQALDRRNIEITDKNRAQGIYYVKYDASVDSGSHLFGNVKIFIFEDEYAEADYKLTVTRQETATSVRAEMMPAQDKTVSEDGEELGDGSGKLLKALYDTIRNELKN